MDWEGAYAFTCLDTKDLMMCRLGPHAHLHSTLTSPVWMPDLPDNEAKVMVASNSSHIIRA